MCLTSAERRGKIIYLDLLMKPRTLLASAAKVHCCLMVNLVSIGITENLFCKSSSQLPRPSALAQGAILPPVQQLAFPFIELYKVPAGLFLQLVEVSVSGVTKVQHMSYSF